MISWLKKLMLLILVNLLTKQIIMLRSKILKIPDITNLATTAALKVRLSPSKKNCFICFFLFSGYLNFCLTFCSCRKNNLIRKTRLILRFMTSQPGQQTNTIHILPNISQSKDSQVMKFGQIITK